MPYLLDSFKNSAYKDQKKGQKDCFYLSGVRSCAQIPICERKALKIIVDIDGYLEEFVIWPDYESGVLSYPEELKKNSVIFLFMYRKMNKEKYHTNIDDLVVEDIILD